MVVICCWVTTIVGAAVVKLSPTVRSLLIGGNDVLATEEEDTRRVSSGDVAVGDCVVPMLLPEILVAGTDGCTVWLPMIVA